MEICKNESSKLFLASDNSHYFFDKSVRTNKLINEKNLKSIRKNNYTIFKPRNLCR